MRPKASGPVAGAVVVCTGLLIGKPPFVCVGRVAGFGLAAGLVLVTGCVGTGVAVGVSLLQSTLPPP